MASLFDLLLNLIIMILSGHHYQIITSTDRKIDGSPSYILYIVVQVQITAEIR